MKVFLIALLITAGVAVIAFLLVCEMKIMKKKGLNGARVLIPFFGQYLFYKHAADMGLLVWVLLIAAALAVASGFLSLYFTGFFVILILFFHFLFCINLAYAFGRKTAYGFGLTFLCPVFLGMLAFGKAQFEKLPE